MLGTVPRVSTLDDVVAYVLIIVSWMTSLHRPLGLPVPPCATAIKEVDVYILYGLELGVYADLSDQDFPAYDQVVELAGKLGDIGILCCYDGGNTGEEECGVMAEEAIKAAKRVLLITSEVLYSAFAAAHHCTSGVVVQMRFSTFTVQTVQSLIAEAPDRFIPVSLAGSSRVIGELRSQRVYNLQKLEASSGEFEELAGMLREHTQ